MTNKAHSNIWRLWQFSRAREWGVHILIYALCGGLYGLAFKVVPAGFSQSYLHIIVLQILVYPVAYLLNDYYDYELDRLNSARANRSLGKPTLNSIALLLLLSFLWILLKYHPALLFLTIYFVIVLYTYSAKPIRLKARGLAGVIAAALGQRLPFFWMLILQHQLNLSPAAFVTIFMTIVGLLFILHHQLEDLEIDRAGGVRTWAVSCGRVFIYWNCLLLRILLVLTVIFLWTIPWPSRTEHPQFMHFVLGYTFLAFLAIGLFSYRYGRKSQLRSLASLVRTAFINQPNNGKRVVILGAGLAGMVAASKLAEWGKEVEIHTPASCLGGMHSQIEGIHISHFDQQATWEYLGMDLSKAFVPVLHRTSYLFGHRYTPRRGETWACRRGNQAGSLDSILYELARRRGVVFHFSSSIDLDMARGHYKPIIATGLTLDVYRRANIPHQLIVGYHAEKEYHSRARFIYYKDIRLGKDFAYVAAAADRIYALVFSRDVLPEGALEHFIELLKHTEGLTFDAWEKWAGAVPTERNLHHNSDILAGTLSSMIDPFYLSGISGALVSGKIAALSLMEPERAQDEFKWFSQHWKLKTLLSELAQEYYLHPVFFTSIAILNAAFKPVGFV